MLYVGSLASPPAPSPGGEGKKVLNGRSGSVYKQKLFIDDSLEGLHPPSPGGEGAGG